MSDMEATVQEQTAEPLAAAVISAPDPIAAAAQTVEQLKAKRAALLDRISVNRSSARTRAFAALTGGGRARQELDDWDAEVAALERELRHLNAALAEGERRHAAALAAEAAKEEQDRAEQARALFRHFAPWRSRELTHLCSRIRTHHSN
jgi:hypothetical protein